MTRLKTLLDTSFYELRLCLVGVKKQPHEAQRSHVSFLGQLDLADLLAAGNHMLVLDTHDTAAPLFAEAFVLVVAFHELLAQGLQIGNVLLVDIGKSNTGGILHVAEFAKVGLTTDEAEGNFLSTAESGQVNNSLDGVDIVGNNNDLSLVLLNEGGDVVKTEFDEKRLGGLLVVLGLSSLLEALLLFGLALGGVLSEQFEELVALVLLESVVELGNAWRHLKALHEDGLLSLDTNVARPLDETGQITLGLDITSNTEVAGALLEERVLLISSSS